jgi:butyrate kinase
MERFYILAINPGSTSTKIAVFEENIPIFVRNIKHSSEELAPFNDIASQYEFRKKLILQELEKDKINLNRIRAIVGRGGLVKPIESGVYEVNDRLKEDLYDKTLGEHASNLGGLIADDIAKQLPNSKAFIADPVVVDEFSELARVSGHPLFERKSIFHALNQKAVARSHAESILKKYEDLNLIVVHLGGGISIGAHEKVKVIDVNQALDGEGPFSPERSGTLPSGDLVRLCFSGKYTQPEIMKMIVGKGGLSAFLGTNSAYEVEQAAAAGDQKALQYFQAMAYQVAKQVGAMFTVLKGNVDSVLITGGIAHSKLFVNMLIERIYKIAPVHVYPGEDEMAALAQNGLKVLKGKIQAKIYA